jgi:hypothetical protein
MRFAYWAPGSSAAPYLIPTSRVVSERSGKLKPNFCAKAALSGTESKLMPRIWTFFSA